jgi:1,4-alpha-glucan branching enzyme
VQTLVRDLNRAYREYPALHEVDFEPRGFEWIDHSDREKSVLSFIRKAKNPEDFLVVAISNFTPVPRHGYRIGVPQPGTYREIVNTDSTFYGGSNVGNPGGRIMAESMPFHGHAHSLSLVLPPLATLLLEPVGG